jgi:hypothetical protein
MFERFITHFLLCVPFLGGDARVIVIELAVDLTLKSVQIAQDEN